MIFYAASFLKKVAQAWYKLHQLDLIIIFICFIHAFYHFQ